ncbi:30S ribosomal protein S9 [Candidatus Nomurabacteria bacterium]|nr:30S ribosomal protein S9 [Candidatus Nomurabacteria bacterium]USN94952.1 MAG: 30S ribosomal protein S9 [Candidatus Nomurabacteria bacterium]
MEKTKKYVEKIGRRKTSTARVRISFGSASAFSINGKTLAEYFPTASLQQIVESPIKESGLDKLGVSVKVIGGGIHSQAEAVRHGISRALSENNETLRSPLKKLGFLKRDARAKERRKFGLKKARKSAQWSKR